MIGTSRIRAARPKSERGMYRFNHPNVMAPTLGGGRMRESAKARPEPGVAEEIAPGIRRVLAPNPSPMTQWGTMSYILGEGEVAIIDAAPISRRTGARFWPRPKARPSAT